MTLLTTGARDPHDLAAGAGSRRAAAARSTRRACSMRPTCTSPAALTALAGDATRWSRWPWRSRCAPCAAARSASTWPRWPTRSSAADAALARPRRVDAAVAASALLAGSSPVLRCSTRRRAAALPRPLLARGGAGARRPARPPGRLARRPTSRGWRRRSTGSSRPRATTSSGPPPGSRSPTRTTVLTGGPGTGKTTTVAALLALCAEQAELEGRPALRIALAAPTGKAAARLQQAVEEEVASCRRPTGPGWPASGR